MLRIGLVLLVLVAACKGKRNGDKQDEEGFSYEQFSEQFAKGSLPYVLTDTGLLRNTDTAAVQGVAFASFVPDSARTKWFGKGKTRYIPMAQVSGKGNSFYIVKAVTGNKKGALLFSFTDGKFGGVFPFLLPDADPSTSQSSSVDKSLSITKFIQKKQEDNSIAEGKEVYGYDGASGQFPLILVNPIDNGSAEVINPIDTLPRKHKFSGDYIKDKRNFISVRDGRYPNQLQVFIHIDKNKGECTGELKGDLLLTSGTAAIYRQGGDPCVLSFRFGSSSVTVKEDEGCGSHRGIDCLFDGSYSRKKEKNNKTISNKAGK
ncbi:MAG TPA: hypothetical protein VFR58_05560 [Flavisolibacter sp.]|nr:hypothetical protein [Flavisolibacter sp.]